MRFENLKDKISIRGLSGSRAIVFVLAAACFIGLLYFTNTDRPVYTSSDTTGIEYEVGKVTGIISDNHTVDEKTGIWRGSMVLQVKLLSGRYKDDTVKVENYFSSLYNIRVTQGDKVSIRIDTNEEGYQVSIYNYYRVPQIILCVVLFFAFLVIIGGKKGAKSALGLIFSIVCIIWILLPLALKGFSVILVTLVLVLICNLVCFFLIDGIKIKTVVAAAGSVCGVITGAIFTLIAQWIMSVDAYQMDEAETLLLVMTTTKLQMHDLLMCGVLIACMGAVMDVAMTIASAMAELHELNPQLGRWELFRSGMNIGKDAMGTMSNTLILAYAGSSLNMMLLIYSYGVGFQQLMNTNFMAIEIIRTIAGSIGIIFTIPIVATIAARIYGKSGKGQLKKTAK